MKLRMLKVRALIDQLSGSLARVLILLGALFFAFLAASVGIVMWIGTLFEKRIPTPIFIPPPSTAPARNLPALMVKEREDTLRSERSDPFRYQLDLFPRDGDSFRLLPPNQKCIYTLTVISDLDDLNRLDRHSRPGSLGQSGKESEV